MRSGSSESGDRTRSGTARRRRDGLRHRRGRACARAALGQLGAREPRGGLLALQPAQAGFKPLEIPGRS